MSVCMACGCDGTPDYRVLVAACFLAMAEDLRKNMAQIAEEQGVSIEQMGAGAVGFVRGARAILAMDSDEARNTLGLVLHHAQALHEADRGDRG